MSAPTTADSSALVYLGPVREHGRTLALLSISGHQKVVAEGATLEDRKLVSVSDDEVIIEGHAGRERIPLAERTAHSVAWIKPSVPGPPNAANAANAQVAPEQPAADAFRTLRDPNNPAGPASPRRATRPGSNLPPGAVSPMAPQAQPGGASPAAPPSSPAAVPATNGNPPPQTLTNPPMQVPETSATMAPTQITAAQLQAQAAANARIMSEAEQATQDAVAAAQNTGNDKQQWFGRPVQAQPRRRGRPAR